MLNYLELTNVGPAPSMRLEFGPRLNILTGNNSLGKTFILDVAWWALTQTWPGKNQAGEINKALPTEGHRRNAKIKWSYDAKTVANVLQESVFDSDEEQWKVPPGRPGSPGLVLYIRTDGGFSVWDPARNYWKRLEKRGYEDPERPTSFDFNMGEIWNGLRQEKTVFCEGLLADWKTWADRNGKEMLLLREVLENLSPSPEDIMKPGGFTRLSLNDVRDIPTIKTPYGSVPVTIASAGVKRMLALAYLITWTYTEHLEASKLIGDDPTDRFTVMIDEVELHLHPQWQRVLLPSILKVMGKIGQEGAVQSGSIFPEIQVIATTHAPLVMASIEPSFHEDLDKVFHFKTENGNVIVDEIPWVRYGDAVGWLISEVFGLEQARSREAERAIEAAEAFMRGDKKRLPDDLRNMDQIHQALLKTLPDHDKFWPRWIVKTEAANHDSV